VDLTREVVCGADIHKEFLVATILSNDGLKLQERFDMNFEGLQSFKSWVIDNGCQKVAVESTANYWYPIYNILEGNIEFVLANAYQIKHIPGRKTDMIDADWIAETCLKGMISPSRILPRKDRDLRALTRTRESLVKTRSQFKNRIHHELEAASIKLSSVLSDTFGKSGRQIVEGLLEGTPFDEILEGLPSKRIRARKEEIRNVIMTNMSPVQTFLIRSMLDTIDSLTGQMEAIEGQISAQISERKVDLKIAMSIPGMGFISAATILAEIGDFRDFPSAEKLAAYCGLVPSVYQSAGKQHHGHITKHGSHHIRRMLVQVAHVITRTGTNSTLKRFYMRVRARKGAKIAIVALARKVLCILYHLLINREMFQEESLNSKPKRSRRVGSSSPTCLSLDDMIQTITRRAGYEVRMKPDLGGG
jgi:transposase